MIVDCLRSLKIKISRFRCPFKVFLRFGSFTVPLGREIHLPEEFLVFYV